MNTLPETLFTALEAVGTVAFAVSGATVALQRKLDIFGVLLLGLTTALGGGCLRDLLLGNTPPVMFREPLYAIVALMTALVVFLLAWFCRGGFFGHMVLIDRINNVFDALGLGMFSVIGVRAGIGRRLRRKRLSVPLFGAAYRCGRRRFAGYDEQGNPDGAVPPGVCHRLHCGRGGLFFAAGARRGKRCGLCGGFYGVHHTDAGHPLPLEPAAHHRGQPDRTEKMRGERL